MEFRKTVTITLYARQQKRHRCREQSFGLCGRGQGWDDFGEWHWNMYIIIYEMNHQSRFNAWDRVLRAGALGWPRGMEWGGRWGGGFRMGNTCTPGADLCQCTAKPLHYCKVISLQLKWINFQKKEGWWTKTTETGMKYLLPPSNTAKTTLRLTKDTNVWKLDHPGAGKWFPFKAKQ